MATSEEDKKNECGPAVSYVRLLFKLRPGLWLVGKRNRRTVKLMPTPWRRPVPGSPRLHHDSDPVQNSQFMACPCGQDLPALLSPAPQSCLMGTRVNLHPSLSGTTPSEDSEHHTGQSKPGARSVRGRWASRCPGSCALHLTQGPSLIWCRGNLTAFGRPTSLSLQGQEMAPSGSPGTDDTLRHISGRQDLPLAVTGQDTCTTNLTLISSGARAGDQG
ncbi:uncharacterized protein LOC129690786 [Psammomys obesus]|uniref:uncharacterized protein LOC129690786 n=1 Tax=Psammomys obesus TaxID=48139 RepID=UPI002452E0C3|nr:uncharacterized protein LOC129690786 [Psammomys obesus]